MNKQQKTNLLIFGSLTAGFLFLAIFFNKNNYIFVTLLTIMNISFFLKEAWREKRRKRYTKLRLNNSETPLKQERLEPEKTKQAPKKVQPMKKEKETITVTCSRCHQTSTIEVKLTSPALYHGVCPKCITEEGFHVDFFITTYQMKEIKEREIQKKKCRKENEDYLKAIAINPNNAEAYNHLGINYYYLKEYQKAIKAFREVITINRNSAVAYYYLGHVYDELEQYQQAIDSYQRAIELDPDVIANYIDLGNVYYELKQYPQAIDLYKKAMAIDPDNKVAPKNLEFVYREMNDSHEAIDIQI